MIIDARQSNTLFEEPYWLDAVSPGGWHAETVKRDGHIIGRLPYVIKRRYGVVAISTPTLTPWLGPWIANSGAKRANDIGHQHEVLAELLKGLPKANKKFISCAPEFDNLMAMHWAGYMLNFGYTYRLSMEKSVDELWAGMRDKTRNTCRKAERTTAVSTERTVADILPVLDMTFQRQGEDFRMWHPVLERIDATMKARKQRAIYAAEDAQGRIHAFAYIVFDDRHTFYLVGGGDPELRGSGAHALALWHAIKDAHSRSRIFDFDGSMIPTIEHFMRSFGATLTPRYTARWNSVGMDLVGSLLRMIGKKI